MYCVSFQEIVVIVTSRKTRADFEKEMSIRCGPVTVLAPTEDLLRELSDLSFDSDEEDEVNEGHEHEHFEGTETEMGNYSILFLSLFSFFHSITPFSHISYAHSLAHEHNIKRLVISWQGLQRITLLKQIKNNTY
jgi:hypothetical protein